MIEPDRNLGEARARYDALAADRQPFLHRAREAAKLTIPSLMVEEGHDKGTQLYQPFQSLGARGVNNLASKLTLAILPPSQPFFRLTIDAFTREGLEEQGGKELVTETQRTLSKMEQGFLQDMETKGDRVAASEFMKQLLVSGNVLLWDTEEHGLRVFRLDEYVCKRDPEGTPIEIIIKEEVYFETLPEGAQELLGAHSPQEAADKALTNEPVDLLTVVRMNPDGDYDIWQEVDAQRIPDSDGFYKRDDLPYFPLRMIAIDGEDYGRGYVEEYFGDLKSLEGLYESIVTFAAVAAKVVFMNKPNGVTRTKALSKAKSGDFITGDAEDITVLMVEKFNDFRVVLETAQRIESRLEQAFMLTSSIQRDAERVTAEEIRLMAQELEEGIGGVYSTLTAEFQLRFVTVRMKTLATVEDWPKLDPQQVRPSITTGLNALGRGHERDRLMQYIAALYQTLGPDRAARIIDEHEVADRLAIQMGIDTDGLVKTPEQIAKADAEAQQQGMASQMLDKLGPKAMDMLSNQ